MRSGGAWTPSPEVGHYRVVNNTLGCIGPRIVIFAGDPPPDLSFPPLPDAWVGADGYVPLCVARGTLIPTSTIVLRKSQEVPVMAMQTRRRNRDQQASDLASDDDGASDEIVEALTENMEVLEA